MTRKIRRDVLELMADELLERQAHPLASFMSCEDGRPKLVGMSRGNRWTLEREQRAWQRANKADLRTLAMKKYRRRWREANPEHANAIVRAWEAANAERVLETRRRSYAKNADRRRQRAREKYATKVKANPAWYAQRLARSAAYRRGWRAKRRADA